MSLSNTRSSQKASAKISYLGYLRPAAWRGMTLFAAPILIRLDAQRGYQEILVWLPMRLA